MSADVGLALRVARCFELIGKIRAEALAALGAERASETEKAPEATVKIISAHASHLREVGGDLIPPSYLGRHLHFGLYCDLYDIINGDLPGIESGIQRAIEELGKKADTPGKLGFEELLHPNVAHAAMPLFRMEDYRGAVIKGCEVLVALIRERTELKLDGIDLVNKAFSRGRELLVVATGDDDTSRNRRAGLADLLRGAMAMIRNVYVHEPGHQPKPTTAVRHLALISTLVILVGSASRLQVPPEE